MGTAGSPWCSQATEPRLQQLEGQEACIQDISTRSVADLVKGMSITGISKRQVSRLCEEIDQQVRR